MLVIDYLPREITALHISWGELLTLFIDYLLMSLLPQG